MCISLFEVKNVGEIATKIDKIGEVKGYVDKAIEYVKNFPKEDLLLYGGIALGVIVLLIIIRAAVKAGRRPKMPYVMGGANMANMMSMRADRRAQRRAERREDRYYRELIRLKRREDYYKPRKHRVRYVKTMAPKVKKAPKVQRVYAAADQSTMMATGIVGMGLGAMAYSALTGDKKKLRL